LVLFQAQCPSGEVFSGRRGVVCLPLQFSLEDAVVVKLRSADLVIAERMKALGWIVLGRVLCVGYMISMQTLLAGSAMPPTRAREADEWPLLEADGTLPLSMWRVSWCLLLLSLVFS